MSSIFTIPFDSKPELGISARLSEFVGDDENQVVRWFDQYLKNYEQGVNSHLTLGVNQVSPLVFFGPSLTGKSCLALAFARRISILLEQNPNDVLILNARDFCLNFAKAIQTKTTLDFRRQFRATRVIVFDDLNHLANKNAACDEFQHLLDEFESNEQAIVITSPTRPDATSGIGDRLASRLCDGLLIPVNSPGIESQRSIFYRLGFDNESELPDQSMTFAEICNFANQQAVGLESVPSNDPADNEFKIEKIISAAAEKLDVSVDDVIGASRMKTIALARCVSIYLIRSKLNISFQQIGKIFSNRDHSTIIHSFNKIRKILEKPEPNQSDVVSLVDQLEKEISECLKPVYSSSAASP